MGAAFRSVNRNHFSGARPGRQSGPGRRMGYVSSRNGREDRVNDFRLAQDVRPTRYRLRFDLDLDKWMSSAEGTITLTLAKPAREITLHSVDLDIKTGGDIAGVTY